MFASRAPDAAATDYTRRRDNAHKIEQLEVLYPWHPWFGRVVHVREVVEQRAGGVLRCSPDGDTSGRWLELPQWMFDRVVCLAIRMAALPRVDSAALIALKTCLADASGTGLCGGPIRRSAGEHRTRLTSANQWRRRHWPPDAMPSRCCEFVDSRLRRSPPDRASAVPLWTSPGKRYAFPPPCPQVGG